MKIEAATARVPCRPSQESAAESTVSGINSSGNPRGLERPRGISAMLGVVECGCDM